MIAAFEFGVPATPGGAAIWSMTCTRLISPDGSA